jgi:hypothetical protein
MTYGHSTFLRFDFWRKKTNFVCPVFEIEGHDRNEIETKVIDLKGRHSELGKFHEAIRNPAGM